MHLLPILVLSPLLLPQQELTPASAPEPLPVRVAALDIQLTLDGPSLRVTQSVRLENPNAIDRPFDLIFPLGKDALVSGLKLTLEGEELEGSLFDADAARREYQNLTRLFDDPALLEHYGEALYRARVFPVPAGASKELSLSYTTLVRSEGELTRLHLPLTAFRRFVTAPLSLTVEGEILSERPVTTLYSPTHRLTSEDPVRLSGRQPRFRKSFRVEQPAATLDDDFLAFLKDRPDTGTLDVTLLSERPDAGEDGYFLAAINGIPGQSTASQAKDVVFVLDHSGSMKGEKIQQAREALKFMANRLGPDDRFNLVGYSAGANLFARALAAPEHDRLRALEEHVDAIVADGGTNIEAALILALEQFAGSSAQHRVHQVVFLTDGMPTEGETDPVKLAARVAEANRYDARIVAFGLGFDVNSTLLDRIAVQNRGLSEYVLPSEEIAQKIPGFYERMQAPLLLDTVIEINGARVLDIYPRETGDLYAGHQILITGRYIDAGETELLVSGQRTRARVQEAFRFELADGPDPRHAGLIARIWAGKKIGFLVDEIRLQGESPELIEEIVRLGTRFGILTEYTAFLAAQDTDLTKFAANTFRCTNEVKERAKIVTGSHGVAQACNSKLLQRRDHVAGANTWYDANGNKTTVGGVQCVGERAFFRRGDTWQASDVSPPEEGSSLRELELFSPEFFALLDAKPWLGRCVARTGDLTLNLDGKALRIRPRSGS